MLTSISCTNSDNNAIGGIPPTHIAHRFYFSKEGIDQLTDLKTHKIENHNQDYYVGKNIIDKKDYQITISINEELIIDSNSTEFELCIEEDEIKKNIYIKSAFLLFPYFETELVSDYTIKYKIKSHKIFGDNEFYEISIDGEYKFNKEQNHHMYINKDASIKDFTIEMFNVPIDDRYSETGFSIYL